LSATMRTSCRDNSSWYRNRDYVNYCLELIVYSFLYVAKLQLSRQITAPESRSSRRFPANSLPRGCLSGAPSVLHPSITSLLAIARSISPPTMTMATHFQLPLYFLWRNSVVSSYQHSASTTASLYRLVASVSLSH